MPTKNRKTVSYAETINHNGTIYSINGNSIYGVYPQLLHVTIEQLEICISKWRRVFVMRFDLHQKVKASDSKMLTMFRKNLMRRIERKYRMAEMGYLWVREQETAKQQHYHFVVFLDGDVIRHSTALSKVIIETWERICEGNTVHIPKQCFYLIADADTKAKAIYRVSYLAKVRGKGYRPNQSKDYGASRLRSLSSGQNNDQHKTRH